MKTKSIVTALVLLAILCAGTQAQQTINSLTHLSRMGTEMEQFGITPLILPPDHPFPRMARLSDAIDMNSYGIPIYRPSKPIGKLVLAARGYSIDMNQFAIPSNNPQAAFISLKTAEKALAINMNDYGIPVYIPKSDASQAVLTAQGTVNMRGYGKGTLRPIVINQDLSILHYEAEGVNRADRSENMAQSPFDQMHFQTMGTLKSDCRGDNCLVYATYRDGFGDMVVVELSGSGQQSDWRYLYGTQYFGLPRYKASHLSTIRKWEFLYGTGKFEGITGTGNALVYTVAASGTPGVYPSLKTGPMAIGSSSCCIHLTGTYAFK